MVTFFFHGHFHAGMKVVFDIKKYRQAWDCVSNSVNLRSFPELFEHFPDVYLQWLDLAFSNHSSRNGLLLHSTEIYPNNAEQICRDLGNFYSFEVLAKSL